jgi:hypothetical protein
VTALAKFVRRVFSAKHQLARRSFAVAGLAFSLFAMGFMIEGHVAHLGLQGHHICGKYRCSNEQHHHNDSYDPHHDNLLLET